LVVISAFVITALSAFTARVFCKNVNVKGQTAEQLAEESQQESVE
jgi:hypothetical protein